MSDTPKCISSSRIASNHDKSIDFDHFTGKNDHYKSVRTQRKCLILTDTQCRSLILKTFKMHILSKLQGTPHTRNSKSAIFSAKICWKWYPCVTLAVYKQFMCVFGQFQNLKLACWETQTVRFWPKSCQKSRFFTTFEHLSPSNIARTT